MIPSSSLDQLCFFELSSPQFRTDCHKHTFTVLIPSPTESSVISLVEEIRVQVRAESSILFPWLSLGENGLQDNLSF